MLEGAKKRKTDFKNTVTQHNVSVNLQKLLIFEEQNVNNNKKSYVYNYSLVLKATSEFECVKLICRFACIRTNLFY